MKRKIFTLLFLMSIGIANLLAQTARLQVIHNAADPAAASVDVWVNGALLPVFDNFAFRTATPFIDVPAGVPLTIAVAPDTSTTEASAIATFNVGPLVDGEKYVLFANGVVGSGFTANPDGANITFDLFPFAGGRESGINPTELDMLIFHGATDAPTVDIVARTGGAAPFTLVDDLSYGDFFGYASIPTLEFALDIKDASGTITVATFTVDLRAAGGGAGVVFASGFLNPGQGPAFGLWVALPDGTTLPLDQPGTARVQVIHNSPDPLAVSVDIYVNGLQPTAELNDLAFRTGTPFFDVETGIETIISINGPASADADDAVVTKINLGNAVVDGGSYILFAAGLVDTSGLSGINPDGISPFFTLVPVGSAKESAGNSNEVDLVIHHGSPDAPTVDIVAKNVATLADDLKYLDVTTYLTVPAANYVIEVKDASGTVTVKSYYAPLETAGGAAAAVYASGFLDPSNGVPFGIFATLPNGLTLELPEIGNARVQAIHNSPDAAASVVDIYVIDGTNATLAKLEDVAFRTATPFLDLPSNLPLSLGFAPANSTDENDIILTIDLGELMSDETYIAIANGIIDTANYNPSPEFSVSVFAGAREAAINLTDVDVLVYHGSTDAPTVDVDARTGGMAPIQLIDDLSYDDFVGYASIPPAVFALDVKDETGTVTVATFIADLSSVAGAAAVVFASGFLDDAQGAAFGLWVALPNGTTFPLPTPGNARVQVIHNSPDPLAATVDIYVNGLQPAPALNNLQFRAASPFFDVQTGYETVISVNAPTSADADDAVVTKINLGAALMDGGSYIVFADGLVDTTGLSGINPDGINPAFTLAAFGGAREAATDTANVDFIVHHGSPDAPTVDVIARNVATLVDDIKYLEFNGSYLSVPAADYTIDITDATGTVTVKSYFAPLAQSGGAAAAVFASGFLDPTNGTAFGIWVALPDGTTFPLPELGGGGTARVQVIHNAADPAAASVDVWVDGALLPALDNFAFRTATPYVDLPAGQIISIAVAPDTSTSAASAIATFNVGPLTDGETYVLFANGVVGSGFTANPNGLSIAFDLYANGGRETGSDQNLVDVLVFHGATDAPTVGVDARTGGGAPIELINGFSYGDFVGYVSIPPAEFALDIKAGAATVATFIADLTGVAGAAAVVYASGFLDDTQGPAFGLWVTLPDGTTFGLPTPGSARVQVIHNSPDPLAGSVDSYVNGLQPDAALNNLEFRKATPFFDVQTGYETFVSVNGGNSANADDAVVAKISFGSALMDGGSYIVVANGLIDTTGKSGINPDGINPFFTLVAIGGAQETGANANNADIVIHHGSPDAPTVDVVARNVGTIADDLAYLDVTPGYVSVPAQSYIIDVKDASGTTTVKSYFAPLSSAAGASAAVFASGFLNPANGVPFGIWVALASGATFPLPEIETARVQAIHNSADAAASVVDVYVTDAIGDVIAKLEDVAFRTATDFLDLPSTIPLTLGFAPSTSTSVAEVIASVSIGALTTGEKYIAIANGILSSTGYNPSPAFTVHVTGGAKEEAANQGQNQTDVLVYHGSTDAPTVDVVETGVGAGTIVDDISYGEFQGYLSLNTTNYVIAIRDASGTTTVAAYQAPLETLGLADAALTVLASGFLDPSGNSNGPAFGLFAALPTAGALLPLPLITGIEEQNIFISNVKFYPNPTSDFLRAEFTLEETANVRMRIFSVNGTEVMMSDAGRLATGAHMMQTSLAGLPSGHYLVMIEAGEKLKVTQPVFVK